MYNNLSPDFSGVLARSPQAWARVVGSPAYPGINGVVRFYQTDLGVLVVSRINGLPKKTGKCSSSIFAYHIHGGASCSGNEGDPFADAGTHYNPRGCPHPYHAGDLPPLFGADGYAFSAFLTNRFTALEIIGKTIIIHSSVDDFTTQPSGNAGTKIACGEIRKY